MAKPSDADITEVRQIGLNGGLTEQEIDAIAIPLIRVLGGARGLDSVRSNGELSEIRRAITDAAARRRADGQRMAAGMLPTSQPLATDRQVSYILTLLAKRQLNGDGGGFMAGPTDEDGIAALTKAEASAYIDSLTERY